MNRHIHIERLVLYCCGLVLRKLPGVFIEVSLYILVVEVKCHTTACSRGQVDERRGKTWFDGIHVCMQNLHQDILPPTEPY
jgi:hypothetical protein